MATITELAEAMEKGEKVFSSDLNGWHSIEDVNKDGMVRLDAPQMGRIGRLSTVYASEVLTRAQYEAEQQRIAEEARKKAEAEAVEPTSLEAYFRQQFEAERGEVETSKRIAFKGDCSKPKTYTGEQVVSAGAWACVRAMKHVFESGGEVEERHLCLSYWTSVAHVALDRVKRERAAKAAKEQL